MFKRAISFLERQNRRVYFYYQERSKLFQTDSLLPIFDTKSIFKAATMISCNGFTSF